MSAGTAYALGFVTPVGVALAVIAIGTYRKRWELARAKRRFVYSKEEK